MYDRTAISDIIFTIYFSDILVILEGEEIPFKKSEPKRGVFGSDCKSV